MSGTTTTQSAQKESVQARLTANSCGALTRPSITKLCGDGTLALDQRENVFDLRLPCDKVQLGVALRVTLSK